LLGGDIVVDDFGVDTGFANSTSNQLSILRTEVYD
jgi:hypothetical protein